VAGVDTGDKDSFTINLYPMLDVFSILIVFLLMNFSTSGESVETKANLELPKSAVKISLDSAATVSITKSEILIQGGVSVPILPEGDIPENLRIQGGITVAYEEFKKIKERNETLKNRNKALNLTEKDINLLTLEADKQTPFKLLKRVMLSAQQAEFVTWDLAVDKGSAD
jgi:biopolymer transport protein ExbD